MKMSPCKVHLGTFQYCLNNTTKLLNSSLIETHERIKSAHVCPVNQRQAQTHARARGAFSSPFPPDGIGNLKSK